MGNTCFVAKSTSFLCYGLMDEKDKLLEITLADLEKPTLVGNIYLGRVDKVVKGIQAVFVELEEGVMGYLPLSPGQKYFYGDGKGTDRPPVQGDALLVQVVSDPIKSKAPKLTSAYSLAGHYFVLDTERTTLGVSNKLEDPEEVRRLRTLMAGKAETGTGLICRTNAAQVPAPVLEKELEGLFEKHHRIMETYRFRKSRTLLHRPEKAHLAYVKNLPSQQVDKYLYDDKELLVEAQLYFSENAPDRLEKCRLFPERGGILARQEKDSIWRHYDLGGKLRKALAEKVWLKSGASLVIQPTEALTVIDVNTEKFTGAKNQEETIRRTNLEAAEEIARQIRLRNISGIIVVDFIDMKMAAQKKELMAALESFCKTDPVQTHVVDMTALGLVEMTRKKVSKSLQAQFRDIFLDKGLQL
ncbi:ribonuclease E/G [Anaerotalea alkaliphila]|uniref:Ribonuclease E/G n=1 Tax=Anaerotalea alkaliphila TaxID=2662126 RepID=A0A7X5HWG1_9FIRM|nr:ribonuclease E/G [Anaerotalea alkaliphila]NDL67917.1 ribonuclease E/G [Anaerotalea alkaliphila]